ncbi:MAG: cytochrome c [Bacteroidia bacterium]|nr:cytochrome c [Bacteroidia bacterium]
MKTQYLAVFSILIAFLSGCGYDGNDTGWEYAPQMYHAIPVEPYTQLADNKNFSDGKNAQTPVEHTVARGKESYAYPYPNNFDGYEAAGKELKNPLPNTPENVAEGKRLYGHYCVHCHGKTGGGDGTVPAAGKFPPPPAYNGPLKELPEGKMFHTLQYGKNLMGSHASQLTPEERWEIILYIQTLQKSGS